MPISSKSRDVVRLEHARAAAELSKASRNDVERPGRPSPWRRTEQISRRSTGRAHKAVFHRRVGRFLSKAKRQSETPTSGS